MDRPKKTIFGPAILVTAAFIGPGTVMIASQAGAKYGFSLLWAVAFSAFAAIVLQEMAARLGIVTGEGLSQAIKRSFQNRIVKVCVLGLILIAILIGNAAYQTGNILGAAAGADLIFGASNESKISTEKGVATNQSTVSTTAQSGPSQLWIWILIIGCLTWILILIGRFSVLQTVLTVLVIVMSLLFLIAACLSGPNLGELAAGFVPRIPAGSEWFVVGLIGTTVVPYNLFLHSSAAAQQWPSDSVRKTDDKQRAVRDSRRDTIRSIFVGGLVTGAILITAAMAFHSEPGKSTDLASVKDVAIQLQPALGSWAKWLFAAGLFAAGLTSAITAPVAAAYAAAGCFGWPDSLADWRLKRVASLIVLVGVVFAFKFGRSPQEAIILAQVANGILLPIVALFLLIMLNRVTLMSRFRNTITANVLGIIVLIVVTLIAAGQLNSVYPKIKDLLNKNKSAATARYVDPQQKNSVRTCTEFSI